MANTGGQVDVTSRTRVGALETNGTNEWTCTLSGGREQKEGAQVRSALSGFPIVASRNDDRRHNATRRPPSSRPRPSGLGDGSDRQRERELDQRPIAPSAHHTRTTFIVACSIVLVVVVVVVFGFGFVFIFVFVVTVARHSSTYSVDDWNSSSRQMTWFMLNVKIGTIDERLSSANAYHPLDWLVHISQCRHGWRGGLADAASAQYRLSSDEIICHYRPISIGIYYLFFATRIPIIFSP